jgi:N-acetyltransferase
MTFDIQPKNLQNEQIKLIPLEEKDFEALYQVASDPLVWEQHPNKLRYQRDVFQNYFEGAIASKGAFFIREAKTNEPIGSSRFYDYDEKDNSIKIGYTFIGRKFWGNGNNKALKKLMLDYVFQYVDKVIFEIGATKIDEFEVEYYGEDSKLNFIYVINKN